MEKDVWDFVIDDKKNKAIKKDKNGVVWWKIKPSYSDQSILTQGIHVVACSGQFPTVHCHHYLGQYEVDSSKIVNYQAGSVATNPNGTYINTSGAVRTEIFPAERPITNINTIGGLGSVCVRTNTSGYVGYVNIYP
jgi:hypothetical protein